MHNEHYTVLTNRLQYANKLTNILAALFTKFFYQKVWNYAECLAKIKKNKNTISSKQSDKIQRNQLNRKSRRFFFYSIKCFTMYSKLLYHIGFVVLNFPKHATCLLLLFLNARIFIRLHTTRAFQQWKRIKNAILWREAKKKIARRTQNVLCTYCICMCVVLCLSSNSRAAGHFNRILSSDALS